MESNADQAAAASSPMIGITFDTGALIGLERRRARIAKVYTTAIADGIVVTTPAVVVAEWWRGKSKSRETILRGLRVELVDAELAKLAGEATAAITGTTAVDAIVMASAARRGDIVYTSDIDDLQRLSGYFPSVRILAA
jgi:predicted nucleic acid-binding protein